MQFLLDVKEEYMLLANLDPTKVSEVKRTSIEDYCIMLRNLRKKSQPAGNGES